MTPDTTKARILVVDDDPQLLDLLTETLQTIGYRVSSAPGGFEAIQRLEEESFDLIITDVKMPDVDGLQLYRKVKRHHPDIPILFITGVASKDTLGSVNPDGFLAKPFRISHIETLIEETLSGDAKAHPGRTCRVLIVGGDAGRRQKLAEALAEEGYLPFAAETHQEAFRQMEGGEFDAVVADTCMGSELEGSWLGRLKSEYPQVAIIATGPAAAQPKKKRRIGAPELDGYLSETFSPDELVEMLNRLNPPKTFSN